MPLQYENKTKFQLCHPVLLSETDLRSPGRQAHQSHTQGCPFHPTNSCIFPSRCNSTLSKILDLT